MKKIMQTAAFMLVLALGSATFNTLKAQYDYRDDEVTYQTFYDELSPYGQWIDHPEYGYVWIPDAGSDFQPYSSNGHWVWTDDYDWMWVSDYDWGWAPFHYGRWDYDDYYGWLWVPGYEWSPAWVSWRDGGDYYGWAPLRPGINISVNFNIGTYNPPYNYWCFVPRRHILSFNLFSYAIPRRRNVTIINQTVIINNYNYSRSVFRTGPRRFEAERYCGRITPVRFRNSYTPGRTVFRNNEINVYRPNVRRDNNRNFAPRTYQRFDRSGDNRIGRTNGNRQRNNVTSRNNNIPRRNIDQPNNQRTPRNNGNVTIPRRSDRVDNGNRPQSNNGRITTPRERQNRVFTPNNQNRNVRPETNRRPNVSQQPQRRVETQQQPQRRVETQRQPQRRIESNRQSQPRQFERNSNNNNRNQNGNSRGSGNNNRRSRGG